MTDMIVEEQVREAPSEPGDHDRFSHYFDKDDLMKAFVEGKQIRAVCGKVMVPTRDGQKFPLCPECKEFYDNTEDDL